MGNSNTLVKLSEDRLSAEVELEHGYPIAQGLECALLRIGIRSIHTVVQATPTYVITRTRLAARDGAKLDLSSIVDVLSSSRSHCSDCCVCRGHEV